MSIDAYSEPDRPSRDEWEILRAAQGRATSADWRSTPTLLAYQRAIIDACAQSRVVVVEKSRRVGATWGAAADAVLRSASARGQGGMDTLYIGTSLGLAKEFVDAAAMWSQLLEKPCSAVGESLFDDGSKTGIKSIQIDFASGFSIVALTSKPRSLRGRQGFAIIDEAAFVDDLDELMKAALAFLMWGGRVLVISTHNGSTNPFNELVTRVRAGKVPYGLLRIDLDTALKAGFYERLCLCLPGEYGDWSPDAEAEWREQLLAEFGDKADEELYCIPSQGSGVFLPAALIEARMHDAPVLRLSVPTSFTHLPAERRRSETAAWIEDELRPQIAASIDPLLQSALGLDVGRYRDLSVLAPLQIGRTMRRVCPFLVEMERLPFEQQQQIAVALWQALPRRIGFRIDGTGLGAGLAEDLALNHGAEAVRISVEWYRTVMPPFKAAFEDDLILIPRDADVAADLRALKVVRGVATLPALRNAAAGGGTRHGDAAIALALAYDATRTATGEFYAYEPARRSPDDPRDRPTGLRHTDHRSDVLAGRRADGLW